MKITDPIVSLILIIILLISGIVFYYRQKRHKNTAQNAPIPASHSKSLIIQAYERLVTLAERVGFKSLISRFSAGSLNAIELGEVLKEAIRNEFEFNLSQQIYVSEKSWTALSDLKDQQLFIIDQLMNALPKEATGKDLQEAMLSYLNADQNASMQSIVLETLRYEARQIIINS
jgi:hypothetical protein